MRILYTRLDGGLSVVNAARKEDLEKVLGSLTDEAYKAHVRERSVPVDAIDSIEIDDSYVLPEREFRDAWKQNGNLVEHDFIKAKDIQLQRVRTERDLLLVKYDGLQARANDIGDLVEQSRLQVVKAELRSATDSLKALTPTSIQDIKNATADLKVY